MPELGLVLTEAGQLALAEKVLSEAIAVPNGGDEIVTLAAQIERAALRLRSDPRGGWEHDLELVESALPSLEAAADSDRSVHRALGRGWFLVGLVRGLWAGQFASGEEALERALRHARAAGDRRQEADIVGRLGFAAWSGPMPVPKAVERCNELLVGAGDDTFVAAGGRRWLASLIARQGRFEEARALVAEAVAAYEELGSSLNATTASAFGYGDVEWLAGDLAASERALRRGFSSSSSASASSATGRAWRRSSPGCSTGSGAPGRRRSSPRSWRPPRPRTTSGRRSCSASPARASSPTRGGWATRRRSAARRSPGSSGPTCSTSTATRCSISGTCSAPAGEEESRECAEHALFLYERKANLVSAGWARAFLEAGVTPV